MKKTLNRELKLFEVAESESFGGESRVMSLVSLRRAFTTALLGGGFKSGTAGWRQL
jgi:hypothetical protein